MALVSNGKSTLNPDAPLYIPAAVRQVEDFSPEWWQLITTLSWYQDYWLSQYQEEYIFDEEDADEGDDITDVFPDTFDVDPDEFENMEEQFEEFIRFYEAEEGIPNN